MLRILSVATGSGSKAWGEQLDFADMKCLSSHRLVVAVMFKKMFRSEHRHSKSGTSAEHFFLLRLRQSMMPCRFWAFYTGNFQRGRNTSEDSMLWKFHKVSLLASHYFQVPKSLITVGRLSSVLITQPPFIESQSIICWSLSPPKFLGKKPKSATKVTPQELLTRNSWPFCRDTNLIICSSSEISMAYVQVSNSAHYEVQLDLMLISFFPTERLLNVYSFALNWRMET